MSENLLVALISGLCAILGACVGGFFALLAAKQNRRQLILDTCSRVLTTYVEYVTADPQVYPPSELISAIESARLVCRSETSTILYTLEQRVLSKTHDAAGLGQLIDQFRSAARKEVKKA